MTRKPLVQTKAMILRSRKEREAVKGQSRKKSPAKNRVRVFDVEKSNVRSAPRKGSKKHWNKEVNRSEVKKRKPVLDAEVKAKIRDLYSRFKTDGTRKYSIRKLADKFSTSSSIVYRAIHRQKMGKSGRPNALTQADENNLAEIITLKSKFGFPVTVSDIRDMVQTFLNRKGVKIPYFKGNRPGRCWISLFIERHLSSLAIHTAQNLSRASSYVTKEDFKKFSERCTESTNDKLNANEQIHPSNM